MFNSDTRILVSDVTNQQVRAYRRDFALRICTSAISKSNINLYTD